MTGLAQPSVASESASERKRLAPIWHTALLLLIILGYSAASYFASRRFAMTHSQGTLGTRVMLITYAGTLIFEWVLFFLVRWGEWMGGRAPVASRIGGHWTTAADIWRDIGIGLGLWIVLSIAGGVLTFLLRPSGASIVDKIVPHNLIEFLVWIPICISAGFCEEYVFRGYFQDQFRLLTGSVWAGVILQAAIFGFAHGYQGGALMLIIVVYGLLFGVTARWRKSLRPGMIAHGWTDFAAGSAAYALHILHRM